MRLRLCHTVLTLGAPLLFVAMTTATKSAMASSPAPEEPRTNTSPAEAEAASSDKLSLSHEVIGLHLADLVLNHDAVAGPDRPLPDAQAAGRPQAPRAISSAERVDATEAWSNPASEQLLQESALALSLGVAWLGLAAIHNKWARTSCPCSPGQVNFLDRIAVRNRIDKTYELIADVTVGIAFALPVAVAASIAPDWREAAADTTVIAQSVFASGIATQIAKGAFSRPYPYMHGPAPYPQQNGDPINYASMWSGHTAAPMAGAVTLAFLLSQRFPHESWTWLAWVAGPALALSGGIWQIAAANHYPTDVLVGAAAGAGAGWLNGWLHRF